MSEHVCPAGHAHGATSTCYGNHQCRCDNCRTSHANVQRQLRKRHAYGRAPEVYTSARGTNRRLQALQALGWSGELLAARLGRDRRSLLRTLNWEQVTIRTHEQVSALYEALWNQQPPGRTSTERGMVTRTRRAARARGYLPPLAWDDIDNDETPPVVDEVEGIDHIAVEYATSGIHVPLTPAERREAVAILHARGKSDRQIHDSTGMAADTALRIRRELGLAPNYDAAGKIA